MNNKICCRLILLATIVCLCFQQARAESSVNLRINELMLSNIDGYMVDYDYPDSWVELHNPTSQSVDIKGMYLRLTTDEGVQTYTLPSGKVSAKGYLVICCDKVSKGLHASFRLDSDGGTLDLLDTKKEVIDEISYPKMLAPGIGYGRTDSDESLWLWETKATPGAKNDGAFCDQKLPEPVFSLSGRVLTDATHVDISLPDHDCPSDAQIYLTTDGSEPTEASTHARSFAFDIDQTTVIRAKVMANNAIPSLTISQSYIFHHRATQIPIVSILTDDAHLYASHYGIFASDTVVGNKANYQHDWRRPINVEYLGVAGEEPWFNQLGETAVSGASSRSGKQKSMKLYANKRFGKKHFDGQFWDDKPMVTRVKSMTMRNGGSMRSTSRINDAFAQKLFGTHIENLDWQAYQPVIGYINGRYCGIYGLRERSNEDYVWANYEGEENIELVDNVRTSTNQEFKKLKSLCEQKSATYADLEPLIDMDEWAEMLCLQIFSGNTDWPYNNASIWRRLTSDSKWRWIVKDIDYMGRELRTELTEDVLTFNYLQYLTMSGATGSQEQKTANHAPTAFFLFKKLLPLPEFRDLLVDKLSVYLGDFLKPHVSTSLLWQMHDEIYDEVDDTFRQVFGKGKGVVFTTYIEYLADFLQERPRMVYQHISDYYTEVGHVIPMTLAPNQADVRINGIRLTEGDFDGAYFSHRKLRLSSGAQNIGWQMESFHRNSKGEMKRNEPTLKFDKPEVDILLNDYPQCDSVAFSTYSFAESEFDRRIRTLGIVPDNCRDWSDEQLIRIDEPQCAYANISGIDRLPDSKDDVLQARIQFYDAQGNRFSKRALISLQGGDDANLFKKNLAIAFCDDEWLGDLTPDIAFGDWVIQDEFHLKAFYNDHFRGIPAIAYKLYNQMTLSLGGQPYAWQRGITDEAREDPELKVYDEARCFPDAFPCVIYVNGSYYGTYAWQLKKHRRNMNQTKSMATHIHLDGTLNDKRLFRGDIDWQKFEIRNPKDLYCMDGSDYDGDRPDEIMDESSPAFSGKKKQVRTAEVKRFIAALSRYYDDIESMREAGRDEASIKEAIAQRFDVSGMIDYMLFSLVTSNYDGFSKNWQWFTYDGQRWFVAPYDLDLTFGYNEDALELWPASQSSRKYDYRMENVDSSGPMLWVKTYYWTELCERYAELRNNGIFSAENILSIVDDWYGRIGSENYDAEWLRWPDSPCLTAYSDSRERIGQWIADRLELEDAYLLSTTTNQAIENEECPSFYLDHGTAKQGRTTRYNILGQPVSSQYSGFTFSR